MGLAPPTPWQGEAACHVGAKWSHSCRECDNDGTGTEKESDGGYHKLFLFVLFVKRHLLNAFVGCKTPALSREPPYFTRASFACLSRRARAN